MVVSCLAIADLIYVTEKTCPLCGNTFPVTKVRSKLRTVRQDTDFNTVFEQINPVYYAVWFCPGCGYAAPETVFADIMEKHATKLKGFLATCTINIDYDGIRSREQAILLYKLAIFYSDFIEAKNSRLAGLYLRLAWLYRETGDNYMENMALDKALEHYELATYKESFPIGNMNEVTMDYLVGQLQFRTGKYDAAAASFSRLIANPQAKSEKRLVEMARDAWNDIKAKRKEQEDAASKGA
jgi:uncharacterized protein (DUF2225 family)